MANIGFGEPMHGQVLAHTRHLSLWVVSLGGTMMHLTLSVLSIVVSVGGLLVLRDAIGVSTMSTKHLVVVRRSRGNMRLSRCRVDGHGIVRSHRAVMGLGRGHEMVSSVSGSVGMLKVCTWKFLACDLGVVLGVMRHPTIVSLSLVMVRSYTIAVVGMVLIVVGITMRTIITICLMRMDCMLKMALVLLRKNSEMLISLLDLFTLGGCVLICGLSHYRHHRSRFIVLTWMQHLDSVRLHFED